MKSLYDFIIEPIGERYNNTKKVDDKELILNTEVFNHQYINREAKVISTPSLVKTNIKSGDTVIVHHNVFRRWHDMKGVERNSRSYINEKTYAVRQDQIFLFKRDNIWQAPDEYCFIKPIKSYDDFSIEKEQPLVGILKYGNKNLPPVGSLVGFMPMTPYEFVIGKERLYRMLTQFITIKYEYQGQEEEYNPSWV